MMGGRVMNSRSDFLLPAGQKPAALAALKALLGPGAAHVASLTDALALASFQITEDEEGNVDDLFLANDSFDQEDIEAIEAIAPFVRPNSYVMFIDDDAEQWAWVFRERSDTHVVEASFETVIPVLESEYRKLTCSRESISDGSHDAATQAYGGDDDECEGP